MAQKRIGQHLSSAEESKRAKGQPKSLCVDWKNIYPCQGDCRLGRGQFGRVIKAIWKRDDGDEVVALKVVKPTDKKETELEAQRAVDAMNKLSPDKRNSITYVYGIADGEPREDMKPLLRFDDDLRANEFTAIIMRYEQGGSLTDYAKFKSTQNAQSLTMREKVHVAHDIARAISDIHGINFVHGDLKPDNILMSSRGDLKCLLADLGFSVFREECYGRMGRSLHELSHTIAVRCSILYGAPEILQKFLPVGVSGAKCTRSTDMYSYGIIMYQLFVEREPFTDPSTMVSRAAITCDKELAEFVVAGGRPDLRALPDDTPNGIADIILACWKPIWTKPSRGLDEFGGDELHLEKRMSAEECCQHLRSILNHIDCISGSSHSADDIHAPSSPDVGMMPTDESTDLRKDIRCWTTVNQSLSSSQSLGMDELTYDVSHDDAADIFGGIQEGDRPTNIVAVSVTDDSESNLSPGGGPSTTAVAIISPGSIGNCMEMKGHMGRVFAVASAVGQGYEQLISISRDSTIRVWDPSSGDTIRTLLLMDLHEHSEVFACLCSGHIVTAASNNDLLLSSLNWELGAEEEVAVVARLQGHTGTINAVIEISTEVIISGSDDETIKLWKLANGTCCGTLSCRSAVSSLVFLCDSMFACGYGDGSIDIWDSASLSCQHTLRGHAKGQTVTCLTILSNGLLASGCKDKSVRLWDWSQCVNVSSFPLVAPATAVVGLPGERIACAMGRKRIKLFSTNPALSHADAELTGHTQRVSSLCFLSDGRLVSASNDKTVRIWRVDDTAFIHSSSEDHGRVIAAPRLSHEQRRENRDKVRPSYRTSRSIQLPRTDEPHGGRASPLLLLQSTKRQRQRGRDGVDFAEANGDADGIEREVDRDNENFDEEVGGLVSEHEYEEGNCDGILVNHGDGEGSDIESDYAYATDGGSDDIDIDVDSPPYSPVTDSNGGCDEIHIDVDSPPYSPVTDRNGGCDEIHIDVDSPPYSPVTDSDDFEGIHWFDSEELSGACGFDCEESFKASEDGPSTILKMQFYPCCGQGKFAVGCQQRHTGNFSMNANGKRKWTCCGKAQEGIAGCNHRHTQPLDRVAAHNDKVIVAYCKEVDGDCVFAPRRRVFRENGACEEILQALQVRGNDVAEVTVWTLGALAALTSKDPVNRSKLGTLGAPEVIVDVLKVQLGQDFADTNPLVVKMGARALNYICYNNTFNKRACRAAGAVAVLSSIVETFDPTGDASKEASETLKSLDDGKKANRVSFCDDFVVGQKLPASRVTVI